MRGRRTARARTAIGIAAPLLLIGALAWPMLFTNATFNEDWSNHLWYLWHQSRALAAAHRPSLFLSYDGGVLYPFYAFYGGTLYALAGTLALALGDTLLAYVLTYLLALAAAYGGWLWLARMFGLRRWIAHVPGLVFVTSAPYLTMVYGLGDWPEFIAVSAMPLMIAAALSVLRAPRLRLWPALALAASATVFFGSHLLTAIWGATCLLLLAGALALPIPAARRTVTRAGLLRLAGLLIPAALVSAWFLLPLAAYETQTVTSHSYPFHDLLGKSMYVVAARHLFTLSRAPDSGTVLTLALPVLAIAWVLANAVALLIARRRGPWMRALLTITGATAAVLVTMTHAGLIRALPRMYAIVEFSFRLESYVLLGVSGMLLATLVLLRDGGPRTTRWRLLLVPICAFSVFGALEQVGRHRRGIGRTAAMAHFMQPTLEQEGLLDYVDDELPILHHRYPAVRFPPGAALAGHTAAVLAPPGVRRIDTNLRAGPDLVHVTGARIVGTDSHADDVLELTSVQQRPARITAGPSRTLPVVAGELLSLLALLALGALLCAVAIRERRVARGSVNAAHDPVNATHHPAGAARGSPAPHTARRHRASRMRP